MSACGSEAAPAPAALEWPPPFCVPGLLPCPRADSPKTPQVPDEETANKNTSMAIRQKVIRVKKSSLCFRMTKLIFFLEGE